MDKLEEKLKALRDQKNLMDERSKKVQKKSVRAARRSREFIRENLTRGQLDEVVGSEETRQCNSLEQRFSVLVCLARVFLAGHPRHKKCEKCRKMDMYIEVLEDIINERKNPLSIKS